MDSESILKMFNPLKEYWNGLEKKKKNKYIVIAVAMLVIIVATVLMLSRTEYSVLYSNLELSEAGEIMTKLTEMGIEAKAEGNGTILVPAKDEAALRMELSAAGYPKTGLNYDLFNSSTGFGTTESEKFELRKYQLQDRLQSAIKSLDVVDDAIVTLYLPEQSSFVLQADKQSASASVILRIKNNGKLSNNQIKGIEELLSKSVQGLKSDQISIIDSSGNPLNKNSTSDSETASNQLELETEISNKYKAQIESMLEPVFGFGRVIAGVRVELDFDKRTTETTTYQPVIDGNSGIPVSVTEGQERATSGTEGGVAGIDPNGGAPSYPEVQDSGVGEYEKSNRTVNYEINQVKELLQKADGSIKNISVSVILDSSSIEPGDSEKVKDIVEGSVGIDRDNVVVQEMKFTAPNSIDGVFRDAQEKESAMKKQALVRNGIGYGVLGLLLLIAILAILRVRRKAKKNKQYSTFESIVGGSGLLPGEEEIITEDGITIKKSKELKYIENSINKDPEFVAQLLRTWLDDFDERR